MPLSLSSRAGPSAFGGAMGRVPCMLCCPAGLAPGEQGRGHPGVTACSPSARGGGFWASPQPAEPSLAWCEELPAG